MTKPNTHGDINEKAERAAWKRSIPIVFGVLAIIAPIIIGAAGGSFIEIFMIFVVFVVVGWVTWCDMIPSNEPK